MKCRVSQTRREPGAHNSRCKRAAASAAELESPLRSIEDGFVLVRQPAVAEALRANIVR